MTITQDFFISVMQAVDNNYSCHLMTSDSRLINIIRQLKDVRINDYYFDILLNTENKNTLIAHALAFNSEKHISYFEIFRDNHLVFISYDGFEKGVISSIIPLSEDFIARFVKTSMCEVVGKITITQSFLIDTLNLIEDEDVYCELQTSYDELIASIKQMDNAEVIDNYSAYFPLNKKNRKLLIDNVIQYYSEEYIHHFAIQKENTSLFTAHDGFEIGLISSRVSLSEEFVARFVNTLCSVILPSGEVSRFAEVKRR